MNSSAVFYCLDHRVNYCYVSHDDCLEVLSPHYSCDQYAAAAVFAHGMVDDFDDVAVVASSMPHNYHRSYPDASDYPHSSVVDIAAFAAPRSFASFQSVSASYSVVDAAASWRDWTNYCNCCWESMPTVAAMREGAIVRCNNLGGRMPVRVAADGDGPSMALLRRQPLHSLFVVCRCWFVVPTRDGLDFYALPCSLSAYYNKKFWHRRNFN